jgi:ribosomal protein L9
MKVLLIQDGLGIGKMYEELTAGDGFALSHLPLKRLALVATPLVQKKGVKS